MQISVSELKANAGKYVELVDQQDIIITKNGKRIARLTNAKVDKVAAMNALIGILPPDADADHALDQARMERLMK